MDNREDLLERLKVFVKHLDEATTELEETTKSTKSFISSEMENLKKYQKDQEFVDVQVEVDRITDRIEKILE